MNIKEPEKIDFKKMETNAYDIVEQEGAAGRAYLRAIEALKCILLRQCPMKIETYVANITDYNNDSAD